MKFRNLDLPAPRQAERDDDDDRMPRLIERSSIERNRQTEGDDNSDNDSSVTSHDSSKNSSIAEEDYLPGDNLFGLDLSEDNISNNNNHEEDDLTTSELPTVVRRNPSRQSRWNNNFHCGGT